MRKFYAFTSGKSGTEFWCYKDFVTSDDVFNFEIYSGQQLEGIFWNSNLATNVIIRMPDPIRNSNDRIIIMDNYFTSLSLFQVIKQKHGPQTVGTINKNRTFVPPLFRATKIAPSQNQPTPLSIFGFSNTGTLVSYCSLTKCVTILFSTLDQQKNERLGST